ncbi:MAG: trypsin-like peptidase domain-containing protein [Bacteroidia bacterium]|nr:trypsin-like peptidase domain-containing protein [Bacteroidia bacterium]
MKRILFFILISYSLNGHSQVVPINDSILRNVFLIQIDSLQGTCFSVNLGGKEFLVTAKHLFKNPANNQKRQITIIKEKKVLNINVTLFIHSDTTIDIAILKLPISIEYLIPFVTGGQIQTGQDVYFLGYPSFNSLLFATQDTTFGILPLVKKAIFSGVKKINNYYLVFLDGHNNPGFSGGPVVLYDMKNKENRIAGVISGYYHENKYTKNSGKSSGEYIEENSGIIAMYTIELAFQIVDQNNLNR